MHSRTHSPSSLPGTHWTTWDTTLAIVLMLLVVVLSFLLLNLFATPAYGQQSIPPTARQAMQIPRFAAKLASHPAISSRYADRGRTQASFKNPADRRRQSGRGWLPDDPFIYDNGGINGTTDAWAINFGFAVSDTFTVPSLGANLTGMSFGAWLFPGDVLQNVEVRIGISPFGSTISDQVVEFTQSNCSGNQYGFNVCTESGSFNVSNLTQGTYWVTLQNANVNSGDPVYWDENSGISQAEENSVGTIPSEAFTLLGTTGTCLINCPPECVHDQPRDGFRILHEFNGTEKSPTPGLAFDNAANVYGATPGGSHGLGLDYQITSRDAFIPLYNFTGGSNGQNPVPAVVGPEGALYGAADGGIQNCGPLGADYCGVVYRLRPSPNICLTALCSWNETPIYRFTGDPDGWKPNGNLVFDPAGNLYGTTTNGGTYGQGTVFQLTPSNGGWMEKVIYSFIGGSDGGHPDQLLWGPDGNLYGRAGVIFQLVHEGDSWIEQVIGGGLGGHLRQDSNGNLYGLVQYDAQRCNPATGCYWWTFGQIIELSPLPSGWQATVLDDTAYQCPQWECGYDPGYFTFGDLVLDRAGNLYASTGIAIGSPYYDYAGSVLKLLQPYQEQVLTGFGGDDFRDLEVDATGRIYGTTGICGSSYGTVWQLTPP